MLENIVKSFIGNTVARGIAAMCSMTASWRTPMSATQLMS